MTADTYNRNSHPAQQGNSATDDTHSENGIENEIANLSIDLDAIHASIDECRARERDLKRFFQKAVLKISWLDNRRERLRIARDLYWNKRVSEACIVAAGLLMDKIPENTDLDEIRKKFKGYNYTLRTMIGPAGFVKCINQDCEGKVPIASRSDLDKLNYEGKSRYLKWEGRRCVHCEKIYRKSMYESSEEREARELEYKRKDEENTLELAYLAEKANLSTEELSRLYELMSDRMWREGRL